MLEGVILVVILLIGAVILRVLWAMIQLMFMPNPGNINITDITKTEEELHDKIAENLAKKGHIKKPLPKKGKKK